MSDQQSDLNHVKTATAILAVCIVQTLNESDPTFQKRFLERLGNAYSERRDKGGLDELETLAWVRELLTGFNMSDGQQKPFLGG